MKRSKIDELCYMAHEKVLTTDVIAARADELQGFGVKVLDSFHVAIAEYSNIDVLLSTDDKFVNLSSRLSLSIRVENPSVKGRLLKDVFAKYGIF